MKLRKLRLLYHIEERRLMKFIAKINKKQCRNRSSICCNGKNNKDWKKNNKLWKEMKHKKVLLYLLMIAQYVYTYLEAWNIRSALDIITQTRLHLLIFVNDSASYHRSIKCMTNQLCKCQYICTFYGRNFLPEWVC